jgi:hypothetical protein
MADVAHADGCQTVDEEWRLTCAGTPYTFRVGLSRVHPCKFQLSSRSRECAWRAPAAHVPIWITRV